MPRPAPESAGVGAGAPERASADTPYALHRANVDPSVQRGAGSPTTLQAAIEAFQFHCRYEKNLSAKTLKAYATDLEQFAAVIRSPETRPVAAIGKEEIRTFLSSLAGRYAAKSIKRKVASTKSMFRYLEA